MLFPGKHITRSAKFLLCSLIIALLLVACGGGGGGGATPTPTPTPTPVSLTTYMGDGYTINYPQGWKTSNSNQGTLTLVTFTDPTGIYTLSVGVTPNPGETVSADSLVDLGVTFAESNLKNPQTQALPPAMVGGDSWSQKAVTGDATKNGQTVTVKLVVLADNHPARSPSTKGFVVVYGTGKQLFDLGNTTYFQPILQSFKFTS